MKVGIIFDNQARPETTGLYCRRALSQLADVEHLLPCELETIPANLFDLFLVVDDGLDYPIPKRLRPRAAWAIDTHVNYPRCLDRFGDADWLFAAQKNGAAQLHSALGREVHWLPLACDPLLHQAPTAERNIDIGFVGHSVGRRRQELLRLLAGRFPKHWIGQAFHQEMAKRYGQFKVAFNCSVAGDVNMRVFEALAFGVPLVTDAVPDNGLNDLFEVDTHLLAYSDDDELISQIEWLLRNEDARHELATKGRNHVLTKHTYQHRMQTILSCVNASTQKLPVAVAPGLAKCDQYFEFERPDVAALVPGTASKILDMGCGGGRLGALLKSRQECSVTGVEMSSKACDSARRRIDRVLHRSLEQLDSDVFAQGEFDCIIFADVLEHLRSPLDVLKKCRNWLADEGALVISWTAPV